MFIFSMFNNLNILFYIKNPISKCPQPSAQRHGVDPISPYLVLIIFYLTALRLCYIICQYIVDCLIYINIDLSQVFKTGTLPQIVGNIKGHFLKLGKHRLVSSYCMTLSYLLSRISKYYFYFKYS